VTYNTRDENFSVADREAKLTIIKTLRLSDALMKKIKAECKTRNLEFSDFMRTAALAAIQRQASQKNRSHNLCD